MNNEGVQIGIASFIINGCADGNPDVFTRVSSHLDWINRTMIDYKSDSFLNFMFEALIDRIIREFKALLFTPISFTLRHIIRDIANGMIARVKEFIFNKLRNKLFQMRKYLM